MKKRIATGLFCLLCWGSLLAQDPKVKEFESKRYDFTIDKVVVFLNVFDADLQVPVKADIVITKASGEEINRAAGEAFTQSRLPVQETYQVQVQSAGFLTESFPLDLRRVKEYEISRNVYLQPRKVEVRVGVPEPVNGFQNLALTMRNQNHNEKVPMKYRPQTGEFYAEVRENQSYELEVRNPVNNLSFYTPVTSPSGNPARFNLPASPVQQLSGLEKDWASYLSQRPNLNIQAGSERRADSLLALLYQLRQQKNDSLRAYRDTLALIATTQPAPTPQPEEREEEDPHILKEARNYDELLSFTEDEMSKSERYLLAGQENIKKRLGQLNEYLEKNELSPEKKEELKAYIKQLEERLEKFDRLYQELRAQNLDRLALVKDKVGLHDPFFKRYWYVFYILGGIIIVLFIAMIIFYFIARTRRKQRDQLAELNEEINQQNEEIIAQRDAIEEQSRVIEAERQKADNLLLNILPKVVADELKVNGRAPMRNYEQVSILFTDFKGFSQIAAKMSPDRLMEELNDCFSGFDEIIARYGMEKIKTIGDAYMCAAGIPEPNTTNSLDSVLAGLEMQEFMQRRRREKRAMGEDYWQCRLGINTGEIRAGVIGTSKFAYDIWGDAVNIASRMESGGEVDKVNISEETYQLVKDFFDCTFRGEIEVKNGLILRMYYVNRILPELSSDDKGLVPNARFIDLKFEKFGTLLPEKNTYSAQNGEDSALEQAI